MANQIRNIEQTLQEREIIKTAPDMIVYLEGTPYLLNHFVNDRKTNQAPSVVSFNDHVTSFNCSYDTDLMIPSGNIGLQVPNYQKYLYQMPGGNNLIQPMMQVQVYAKAYFMTTDNDTIYRRVFKGLVSHVGYNDNGKTLEISVQCYGTLKMLELMLINVNPGSQTAAQTGVSQTIYTSKFAMMNPYKTIAVAFTYGLSSDTFQLNNLNQPAAINGPFGQAVKAGYINKWQAILKSLSKDVHIFGWSWKDNLSTDENVVKAKPNETKKSADQTTLAAENSLQTNQKESDEVANDAYYGQIRQFLPERSITDISLLNNAIIPRTELIRKMVRLIDFECYQDIDGKIIVKPPLYNLDVLNIGTRTQQTTTTSNDRSNSFANPATAIYPDNNPFVVQLSEILTEQESEDQSAIRRTRTVVSGNIDPRFQFGYNEPLLPTHDYIDIAKLIKFGLREEPVINCPWLNSGNGASLYAHAAAETVRANRGYRTYVFTIPIRPELKLGFPIFIPHRDMYGYVKTVAINYQVGGAATMTVTCDSIRRRILVNTTQQDGTELYTSAPNLVFKWTKVQNAQTTPDPNQSPTSNNNNLQLQYAGFAQGGSQPSGQPDNVTDLKGDQVTFPSSDAEPSEQQKKVRGCVYDRLKNVYATKPDEAGTTVAAYYIQNDGDQASGTVPNLGGLAAQTALVGGSSPGGYFTKKRLVDGKYLTDITANGVIPFTDDKGYELLSPFPWGRWMPLNSAIRGFTEDGWIASLVDSNGNPTINPSDELVLQNTDAFLYAGVGRPIAQGGASDALQTKLKQISNSIGGSFTAQNQSPNTISPDATVLVFKYQKGGGNDSSLLKTAQPEDDLVKDQITNIQNAQQHIVDVLVSGRVAPTQLVKEALLVAQTPIATTSIGSTPSQQAQEADRFVGTPLSDDNAIGLTPTQE